MKNIMEFTIKYKNGFTKTIIIDGLFIYGKKLVYRTDNKQYDIELAYIESFSTEWSREEELE